MRYSAVNLLEKYAFNVGVCILLLSICGYSSARDSEEEDEARYNAVQLTVLGTTLQQWRHTSSSFRTVVSDEANWYCGRESTRCGLRNWTRQFYFSATNVHSIPTYPRESGRDVIVRCYLSFAQTVPASILMNTAFVLNKGALKAVLIVAKGRIETETGHVLTTIEDDYYRGVVDMKANIIMISAACGVLVLLVIVLFILMSNRKRVQKEASRHMRMKSLKAKISRRIASTHPQPIQPPECDTVQHTVNRLTNKEDPSNYVKSETEKQQTEISEQPQKDVDKLPVKSSQLATGRKVRRLAPISKTRRPRTLSSSERDATGPTEMNIPERNPAIQIVKAADDVVTNITDSAQTTALRQGSAIKQDTSKVV